MKKNLIVAAVATLAAAFATAASAQSSVTLYGIVDAGLTFVNNVVDTNPTHTNMKTNYHGLTSGNLQESRWGMRGSEDLGGGMKAIFNLESGFSLNNGQADNRLFGRQAYVGLSSDAGTVTLGRQYDSVVDYLGPLSAAGTWGGTYFGHAFGNDNLNSNFSIANVMKFQSNNYSGFSFSGLYGFSNQAGGFADNRAYSLGAGYANGPFKFGAAYMQGNGVNSSATGAISGEQFASNFAAGNVHDRQRTFGAGGSYSYDAMTFGAVWTQSRLNNSDFQGYSNVFNNFEVNGRYLVTPALALGAAYTYSTNKVNAFGQSSDTVHFHQFGLQADYALSKRTDFHVEAVAQIAGGGADGYYPQAAIANNNGAFGPSSSSRQVLVNTGIRHRF
ncbi:Outer membrane protein (porin) [Candidatus Burkholderia verschuerenii]|uniref:Outer membrane protein (Porin) n=1 Tax=Candidatus Burkholderia verschuerenii TaxID=242163 RepID=A0A0L0MDW1_9BURK|nr:porin [Candidatus Burkholderia verschuerenii]KND60523.1 Outer membrane protein (porin) [Candidatus Burkholderia verschuerenii]